MVVDFNLAFFSSSENVTVKTLLKSVHIYQSYCKKNVAQFFWPTLYVHSAVRLPCSSSIIIIMKLYTMYSKKIYEKKIEKNTSVFSSSSSVVHSRSNRSPLRRRNRMPRGLTSHWQICIHRRTLHPLFISIHLWRNFPTKRCLLC